MKKFIDCLLLSLLICCFILGGKVSASNSGMEAFRESLFALSKADNRIVRQEFAFFGPTAEMDLEFFIQNINDNAMHIKGSLDLYQTDEKGESKVQKIPFYVDQNLNEMIIYYNMGTEWEKYVVKDFAEIMANAMISKNETDFEEYLKIAKRVNILSETNNHRTMFITFDGKKMFKMLEDKDKKSKTKNVSKDYEENKTKVFEYLDESLKKSNVTCTWTVDKFNWKTVNLTLNLSELVNNIAALALKDPNIPQTEELQSLLETLAYYSELRAYTNYLKPEDKSFIEIPEEVRNAKLVDSMFSISIIE